MEVEEERKELQELGKEMGKSRYDLLVFWKFS